MTGLHTGDFEVLDNGVPQRVELMNAGGDPLNVVLALDESASVTGSRLDDVRAGAHALAGMLKPEDRLALLTFGAAISVRPLTAQHYDADAEIDAPSEHGDTALVDASYAALLAGGASSGSVLTIVFSDGVDTASFLSPERVVAASRRMGAIVYAVLIKGSAQDPFLSDLCAATAGRALQVDSTRSLAATFRGIFDEFRHRYVLGYSPVGVSKAGWHHIEVKVKSRHAVVLARPGYFAGP